MSNQPDFERIRGYLVSQAEKPFAELRGPVEEARAALLAELNGLTEVQALFKPGGEGEEGWCVLEVLRHCIHEEEGGALRIRSLGMGDAARGSTIGRVVGRGDASLAGLVRDLQAANFAFEHAAGSVEGKENLEATSPHPWFGELNCRGWYIFQRIHDMDHVRQIQRIKATPGFP
jgi:hypothetical protein